MSIDTLPSYHCHMYTEEDLVSGVVPHMLWRFVCSRWPVKVPGKHKQVGSMLLHLVVLMTAAGLQGEQPLVNRIMYSR